MGSESERSVDELLVRLAKIDQLTEKLNDSRTDDMVLESRQFLSNTQTFIDNNKFVIPGYSLKKVTDSLKRLEAKVNEPKKTSFKFKSAPQVAVVEKIEVSSHQSEQVESSDKPPVKPTPKIFGFQNEVKQQLALDPSQVEYKDVSLINLSQCNVRLKGLANTVYIRNLKNSTVIVGLACRAITVANCSNCQFKFVCQQLRIDSTEACKFEIFTSARSMLEASKDLEFKAIAFDRLDDFSLDEVQDLLNKANFNISQNNWRSIDDFDWLSPNTPSKNFKLSTD